MDKEFVMQRLDRQGSAKIGIPFGSTQEASGRRSHTAHRNPPVQSGESGPGTGPDGDADLLEFDPNAGRVSLADDDWMETCGYGGA
jgi:hypothetical protein